MNKDKLNVEYLNLVCGLKDVKRYKRLPTMHESVASHSFMSCFLADTLIDEYNIKVNKQKVIELLLYHDLPEVGMDYDIQAVEVEKNANLKMQKTQMEHLKVEKISKKYNKSIFHKNFVEFDEAKTQESKFANLIDKLESSFHVLNRKCKGFTDADFIFQINCISRYVSYFPELKPLFNEVNNQIMNMQAKIKKENKSKKEA